MSQNTACNDLTSVDDIIGLDDAAGCVECLKTGDRWVHLRTCQTCGLTHCCDSSPNQHATQHHHATGHPVIASAEPGERWLWCYGHNMLARY